MNRTDQLAFLPLANQFTVGTDGWVRIAPYGDSVKERVVRSQAGQLERQRFIQRLTPDAAEEISRKANSIWGALRRFRIGLPIYRGHPDLGKHSPEVIGAANEATPQELGVFAEIAARENGLYGRPILNEQGRIAAENEGLKWLSPFWWVRVVGDQNGIPVVQPHELISAGLTDRPNILGGDALANETMDLTKLASALGLPPEATIEEILAAILELKGRMATAAEAVENEKRSTATANERAEQLEAQLAQANTGYTEATRLLTAANARAQSLTESLANERTGRNSMILDAAIRDGRITPAQRGEWEQALANETERDSRISELVALKPVIKTTSVTGGIGARKGEQDRTSATARDQVISLANARVTQFGEDWTVAFNAVRRSHPALFESMEKPAAS